MVTSAQPGEGKSTTALALAVNFAQLGMKVLLIDADLRNPSQHRNLKRSNGVGLANYLAGGAMPGSIFQETDVDGLYFMPSGPLPPNPAELLAGPKMMSLLSTASEKIDIVIIDAPPVYGLGRFPIACEHGLGNAACRIDRRYSSRCGEGRTKAPSFCSRAHGRSGHEQMRFSHPLWLWWIMVTGLTTPRWNITATGKKIDPLRCNIRLRVRRWRSRHVIDLALDLARMPALARSSVLPAIPPNIIELMRIAAASPEACRAAVAQTGEPVQVVIEASRFYLQQVLFRPDADCYRILGIEPAASRATARSHMRWLLQWLHPDRNNNSWDAVYAERVLKAWREVSAADRPAAKPSLFSFASSNKQKRGGIAAIRRALDRTACHTSVTSHPKFLPRIYHMGRADRFNDNFLGFVVGQCTPSALSQWRR